MAKIRQLPELYLRGSLANVTMAGLSPEQRAEAEQITKYVSNHHMMTEHRNKVIKKLSVTIAADYADDRSQAQQEFDIAIWRGVVNLLYHKKYNFTCQACKQSHYMTKRSTPRPIDRIQVPCPSCQNVQVDDPGDVESLVKGQYLTLTEFQDSYKDLPFGLRSPKLKSSIIAIAGDLRYDNPRSIIEDPVQMQKFFGEFVWNYFRQQINENKRTTKKSVQLTELPADKAIVNDIINLCLKHRIEHNYCDKTAPIANRRVINLVGLSTHPEFSVDIWDIKNRAAIYGIDVTVTNNEILVGIINNAPKLTTFVLKSEYISVVDSQANSADSDNDSSDYTVSQISHRTVGAERMDQANHVDVVDFNEAYHKVRESLPDGTCKDVFDLLSQNGERYSQFSEVYGDGETKINHIAKYLSITPRVVNTCKDQIRLQCLALGFVLTNK